MVVTAGQRLHLRTGNAAQMMKRGIQRQDIIRRSRQVAAPRPFLPQVAELHHRPDDIPAGGRRDSEIPGQLPEPTTFRRLPADVFQDFVEALDHLDHAFLHALKCDSASRASDPFNGSVTRSKRLDEFFSSRSHR
ncbi:hypothetical protein SDC9_177309 [bioreactor metagenome]|uniref:Uncharacterized protein n=1 Tax=bioreactor metagenome TaxID=1076179 RepID=A0A645GUC8_9ZZZZ